VYVVLRTCYIACLSRPEGWATLGPVWRNNGVPCCTCTDVYTRASRASQTRKCSRRSGIIIIIVVVVRRVIKVMLISVTPGHGYDIRPVRRRVIKNTYVLVAHSQHEIFPFAEDLADPRPKRERYYWLLYTISTRRSGRPRPFGRWMMGRGVYLLLRSTKTRNRTHRLCSGEIKIIFIEIRTNDEFPNSQFERYAANGTTRRACGQIRNPFFRAGSIVLNVHVV